jgi:hypothetical protein
MNLNMSIMAKPLYDRRDSSICSFKSISMEKGNCQVEFEFFGNERSMIKEKQSLKS